MEMSTDHGYGDECPLEASAEIMTGTETSGSTTDETIRQAMDRVDLSSTQATQASEEASFEPVPFFVLESKPVVPLEPLVLSDEDPAEENVELMLMAGLRALPESAFDCFDCGSSSAAAATSTAAASVAKAFADKWFDCAVQRLANASLHLSIADVSEADIDEAIQRFSTPYGEILVALDAPLEDSDEFVARLSGRQRSRSRRQRDATCSLDADFDADSDSHSDSDSDNDDELSSIAADGDSVHAVTWTLLNVVTIGTSVALPADRALHEHIYTYVHETNALYQGKFIIEQPVVEARGLRSARRVIFFAWKQRLHLTLTATGNTSRKRRRSSDSPVTVDDDEACDDAEMESVPSAGGVSSPVDQSKRPKLRHDNGDDATEATVALSTTAIIVDHDDGRDA